MSLIIKGEQLLNTLSKGRYYLSGSDYTFRPDFFFVSLSVISSTGEGMQQDCGLLRHIPRRERQGNRGYAQGRRDND